MLHFHLIVVGKLKESYWQAAENEYLKRLKPFAEVIVHELKEESFDEKSNADQIKSKEAEKINLELKKIKDGFLIVLDEHGEQFSSRKFSEFINTRAADVSNNLIFVLGGPLGLDQSILNLTRTRLALSTLTFTHQEARVILLEQLYRAMMIANNRKYHY